MPILTSVCVILMSLMSQVYGWEIEYSEFTLYFSTVYMLEARYIKYRLFSTFVANLKLKLFY